jgi:glycosyltransferase involved in cell wall biosynthesis
MIIGIDGSRAFIKNKTGIEEYSYQVIKGLAKYLSNEEVILYVKKNQEVDFEIPEKWKIKVINFPRLWTQVGLSLEMFLNPVEVLFVPAHTVPIIHPKKTVVTVHGLEYEFCPAAYSAWERFYMRFSIKNSCLWASEIISVSQNTKKDLMDLYKVSGDRIDVIHEGCEKVESLKSKVESDIDKSYLLFIGRIEERKNVANIIKAFEILKKEYKIPHQLLLAGKPGYGYEEIKLKIKNSKYSSDIIELGFVSECDKWELLKNAKVFVFPTQYEGFGIPILEAQSVGCPVVASNNSSIPEIVQVSASLVDPENPTEIAKNVFEIISNDKKKKDLVKKGLENVKRFSWEKCAKEISIILKVE